MLIIRILLIIKRLENNTNMENRLHELAKAMHLTDPLPDHLIRDLDELTHNYQSSNEKTKFLAVKEAWELIQNCYNFWVTMSQLIGNQRYVETRFQALNCIEKRVAKSWR